jgi:hypothetical protein
MTTPTGSAYHRDDLRGFPHVFLRLIDFRTGYYAPCLIKTGTGMVLQIPISLVATLLFGLQ